MSIGTVFVNNRTQAVRLPLDVRLPEGVQKVEIRVKGTDRTNPCCVYHHTDRWQCSVIGSSCRTKPVPVI